MKNLKAPFLAFALILLNISIVSAYNNPPPPDFSASTTSTADDENPVDEGIGGGGERLPIDQNIMMLLIGGLALGATVIYRNQTKKASN